MNYSDKKMVVGLVAVWLVVVVSGFWWFQFKDLRAFASESSVVFFQGNKFQDQLAHLVKNIGGLQQKTTLVHFWDSECSCNRFNEPHVKALIEKYAQQNIQFIVVARITDEESRKEILERAKQIFNQPAVISVIADDDFNLDSMPSMPAVAVLSKQQKLMYFGPYSVGAVCNAKNGAFVEKSLDGIIKGTAKKQLNVLATGCFCNHKSTLSKKKLSSTIKNLI